MPIHPPRLRSAPHFLARWPLFRGLGFAASLVAALVLPSCLVPAERPAGAAPEDQRPPEAVPDEVTATVGSPDGGIARGGKLPQRFPETWMKAPCPEGQNMRTVRGHCFVATGQKPPCGMGHEEAGECLLALTGAQPTPNTIQR